MTKEVWKNIDGFGGYYQISNLGRVKTSKGNLRALSLTHDGYVKVRLLSGGKDVTARVHRLVAAAFVPNENNLETVNHKDGNKQNNSASNLEWINRKEQMKHAYKMGLKKPVGGVLNGNAKLTNQQVQEIRRMYVRYSKTNGTVALAKKYGVTNAVISRIVRGVAYAS